MISFENYDIVNFCLKPDGIVLIEFHRINSVHWEHVIDYLFIWWLGSKKLIPRPFISASDDLQGLSSYW